MFTEPVLASCMHTNISLNAVADDLLALASVCAAAHKALRLLRLRLLRIRSMSLAGPWQRTVFLRTLEAFSSGYLSVIPRRTREYVIGTRGGRGWSAHGLPCVTADAEDGVARRFGDKRLQRGVECCVEKRSRDRDFCDIPFQHRRAFFWPEFDNGDGLRLAAAAERHLARGSGIAHPGDLAIGCDEPTACPPARRG
jgi:hypothetical protein